MRHFHPNPIEKEAEYIHASKMALDIKLTKLMLQLASHIQDDDIHVTPEDKARWNNMVSREEHDAFVKEVRDKFSKLGGDSDEWDDSTIVTIKILKKYLEDNGYLTRDEIIALIKQMFGQEDLSKFLTEVIANGIYVRKDELERLISSYIKNNTGLVGQKGEKGDKGDKGDDGKPTTMYSLVVNPSVVVVPSGKTILTSDVFNVQVSLLKHEGDTVSDVTGTTIRMQYGSNQTQLTSSSSLRLFYGSSNNSVNNALSTIQNQKISSVEFSATVGSYTYRTTLAVLFATASTGSTGGSSGGISSTEVQSMIDASIEGKLRLGHTGSVASKNTRTTLVYNTKEINGVEDSLGEGGSEGGKHFKESVSYFCIAASEPALPTQQPQKDPSGQWQDIEDTKWKRNQPNEGDLGPDEYIYWAWIGYYSDETFTNWFGPVRIGGSTFGSGSDTTDQEFIYARSQQELLAFDNTIGDPSTWTSDENFQNDDYIREDKKGVWKDNPQGVTETYRYEYVSVRKKADGVWSPFTQPVLWCAYGSDGKDGDGVEYIFSKVYEESDLINNPSTWYTNEQSKAGESGTAYYTNSDGSYSSNRTDIGNRKFNTSEWIKNESSWTDNPSGVMEPGEIEYVSVRKYRSDSDSESSESKDAYWHQYSTPTIWSRYGKDALADGAAQFDDDTINLAINDQNKNVALKEQTFYCFVYQTTGPVLAGHIEFDGLCTDGIRQSSPSGMTVTENGSYVTIAIAENTFTHTEGVQRKLKFNVWKADQDYSGADKNNYRVAYIHITMVKTGSDGADGASYKLVLNTQNVYKGVGTQYGTFNPSTLVPKVVKTIGDTSFEEKSVNELWSGFSITYSIDGGTETVLNTNSYDVTKVPKDTSFIRFTLRYYIGGGSYRKVDQFTVWFTQNGKDGIATCTYLLSCSGAALYNDVAGKADVNITADCIRRIGNSDTQPLLIVGNNAPGFEQRIYGDTTYPTEYVRVMWAFDSENKISDAAFATGGDGIYSWNISKQNYGLTTTPLSIIVQLVVYTSYSDWNNQANGTVVDSQIIPVTPSVESGTSPVLFYSTNTNVIIDTDSSNATIKTVSSQGLWLTKGDQTDAAYSGVQYPIKVTANNLPTNFILYDAGGGRQLTVGSTFQTYRGVATTYLQVMPAGELSEGTYYIEFTDTTFNKTVTQNITVKKLAGEGSYYNVHITPSSVMFAQDEIQKGGQKTVDGMVRLSYGDNNTNGELAYAYFNDVQIIRNLTDIVTASNKPQGVLYTDGIELTTPQSGSPMVRSFSKLTYSALGKTITWYEISKHLSDNVCTLEQAIEQGFAVVKDSQPIVMTMQGEPGEKGTSEVITQTTYKHLRKRTIDSFDNIVSNSYGSNQRSSTVVNGYDSSAGREVQDFVVWDGFESSGTVSTDNVYERGTDSRTYVGVDYFGIYLCTNTTTVNWNEIPFNNNFTKVDHQFSIWTSYLIADQAFINSLAVNQVVVTDDKTTKIVGGMTSSKAIPKTKNLNGEEIKLDGVTNDSVNGDFEESIILWAGTPTTATLSSAPFYVTDKGRVKAQGDIIAESFTVLDDDDNIAIKFISYSQAQADNNGWNNILTESGQTPEEGEPIGLVYSKGEPKYYFQFKSVTKQDSYTAVTKYYDREALRAAKPTPKSLYSSVSDGKFYTGSNTSSLTLYTGSLYEIRTGVGIIPFNSGNANITMLGCAQSYYNIYRRVDFNNGVKSEASNYGIALGYKPYLTSSSIGTMTKDNTISYATLGASLSKTIQSGQAVLVANSGDTVNLNTDDTQKLKYIYNISNLKFASWSTTFPTSDIDLTQLAALQMSKTMSDNGDRDYNLGSVVTVMSGDMDSGLLI